MNTKLTLKLDNQIISKAKGYAQQEGKSLSQLVEDYFRIITDFKEMKEEITPIVRELSGVIRMQEDDDLKEKYTKYLTKKYK